jgi:hypothetical protein
MNEIIVAYGQKDDTYYSPYFDVYINGDFIEEFNYFNDMNKFLESYKPFNITFRDER